MANLKSLFVWVPSTVEGFNGATVSAGNPSKIYFESAAGKIWVQGVSFGFNNNDLTDVTGNINVLQNAVNVLNGGTDVEGSVAKSVKDAVDSLLGGENIAEAYNTIKEIAEWIAADTTRAAELTQSVAQNTNAINAEVTRAKAAEEANTTAINNEVTRAQAAEKKNADDLASEIARAKAAEEANTALINDLKDEVIKNEEVIATSLNDQEVRILALENDTTNADAIKAEKERAEAAESGLSTRITTNADAIKAEKERAEAAESGLSTRITTNANDISAEQSRAEGVENNLTSRIEAIEGHNFWETFETPAA